MKTWQKKEELRSGCLKASLVKILKENKEPRLRSSVSMTSDLCKQHWPTKSCNWVNTKEKLEVNTKFFL